MTTQDDGGVIVNCSSIGGIVGTTGLSAYAASKFALIGLTKSAALEYIGRRSGRSRGPCVVAVQSRLKLRLRHRPRGRRRLSCQVSLAR